MKTKEEYLLALDRIDNAYNNFDRSISAVGMFIQDFNLFLGLVNEHFEDKQETNFEHYFEYLSKLNMGDFALIDGRVTKCSVTQCSECDFNGDCIEGKFRWLKQPYKKLPYKLSQFEFDIIQTYRDCHESCKISEFKQLIELKDKGYFKCIDHDTKIQDVLKNCEVIQ
jgi:hypothetical protein